MSHPALQKVAAQLPRNLLLFDGVCHYCNDNVTWLLDTTRRAQPVFVAPVASREGEFVLARVPEHLRAIDTMFLIEKRSVPSAVAGASTDGGDSLEEQVHVYIKSEAAFRCLMLQHSAPRAWAGWLLYWLVPRAVGDFCYDRVARTRYDTYGKADACIVPTPAIRAWLWKLK